MTNNFIKLIIAVAAVAFFIKYLNGKRNYNKKTPHRPSPIPSPQDNRTQITERPNITDPSYQLRLVSQADFRKKKLMNFSEFQLFSQLEKHLRNTHPSCRLFSQVSMGEFLECHDRQSYSCINSKRVDFLIIDGKGQPFIVIEYQGEGHYQGNARERDEIKKKACENAQIAFVEVFPNQFKEKLLEIETLISKYYNKNRECNSVA